LIFKEYDEAREKMDRDKLLLEEEMKAIREDE
jgi:hypothetical protein